MAEVYRAKLLNAPEFERFFAIKRILPNLAADKEFVTMFINEAKVAVDLEHPNVCQIYELGRLGESHYIAMEYIPGRDVTAIQNYYRKQKKIMSVSQACFIMAQAAQGLDYAHRAVDANGQPLGLVHRDVSPQNLIVTYDGVVKLIDFGVSKASRKTAHTRNGVVKGKFSYMSPEQAMDGNIDHRSDIFALGVLFWELLTGRRLFQSESEFAIIEKITECNIEKPSKLNKMVPEAVDRICMKALEKDVNQRYAWASDMVVDLLDFINSCKTPFTQWHLQNWMCSTFQKELETEWEKLPIFKSLNTQEDVNRYNAEHAEEYSKAGQSNASEVDVPAAESESLSDADKVEVEKANEKFQNKLSKPAGGGLPSLPPIPGRGVKRPGESSRSLPNVKAVNINDGAEDSKVSGARLSISASSLSENDEDVELEPEGVAPTVSDPQILLMKRAEKKARTRKGLVAVIVFLCVVFISIPILILAGKIKVREIAVDLPTTASLSLDIIPENGEAHTAIYHFPKGDDPEIASKDGQTVYFDGLEAGDYLLDVTMPGYEPESFMVKLENGKSESRVEMTHQLPQKTEYEVNVDPEDAHIFVNGVYVPGEGAVRHIEGVVGAPYSVRAFKLGFEPQTLSGNVENDMSLDFELVLGSPVSMVVQSEPPRSPVVVTSNGKVVKKGEAPLVLENVDINGTLNVEVKRFGYQTWTRTVDFDSLESDDIRFFADLKPVE
ncbi:MAG: serine/threonine protein kinase [Proteobacteria bacterium]|nr:serine/threonine protein kinase [Pseudomonadota bacterium]MBQ4359564.1 serine/threonine protein kinase [Pseudomonadota bacterium]